MHTASRVVSWIPPKTGDLPYQAARWAQAGTSADSMAVADVAAQSEHDRLQYERARQVEEKELLKNPIYSIGSSLLFEAVVVLAAVWSFARRDF